MKLFFRLILLLMVVNSCDDGDLTLESINFDNVNIINSCSTTNILYKLKENEALYLEIPKTEFENEVTPINDPKIIDIDNETYKVIYRSFDGKVTESSICSTIPAAKPSVTNEWIATSGKIEIVTTTITKPGTIVGSTVITGYNHNITFKNITFDKKTGPQRYESFAFGDFTTSVTELSVSFDKTLDQCSKSKQVYNFTTGQSLTLENIDSNLLVNQETPLDKPRTVLIGKTKNILSYRLYTGVITASYFCNTTTPDLPKISEEWIAANGVAAISGIIEVTTIKSGTTAFKHTIVIKNATLEKGNTSFKLGEKYEMGELITF